MEDWHSYKPIFESGEDNTVFDLNDGFDKKDFKELKKNPDTFDLYKNKLQEKIVDWIRSQIDNICFQVKDKPEWLVWHLKQSEYDTIIFMMYARWLWLYDGEVDGIYSTDFDIALMSMWLVESSKEWSYLPELSTVLRCFANWEFSVSDFYGLYDKFNSAEFDAYSTDNGFKKMSYSVKSALWFVLRTIKDVVDYYLIKADTTKDRSPDMMIFINNWNHDKKNINKFLNWILVIIDSNKMDKPLWNIDGFRKLLKESWYFSPEQLDECDFAYKSYFDDFMELIFSEYSDLIMKKWVSFEKFFVDMLKFIKQTGKDLRKFDMVWMRVFFRDKSRSLS